MRSLIEMGAALACGQQVFLIPMVGGPFRTIRWSGNFASSRDAVDAIVSMGPVSRRGGWPQYEICKLWPQTWPRAVCGAKFQRG